jgi:hypothetical protein
LPLVIPRAPGRLGLAIERYWNGAPCSAVHRHGRIELSSTEQGLALVARLPHQPEPRVPSTPRGARVADLWEYDVVECFLTASDGRYLEVELGAGGHFLVLSFSAPRVRSDAHASLSLPIGFVSDTEGWRAETLLPWHLVPRPLSGLNAFVIAGGEHLAFAELPGSAPDFHQPREFPRAVLDEPPGLGDGPE